MEVEPFAGPLLKIERAHHHISDIEAQICKFLYQGKIRLVSEIDTKSRRKLIRIEKNEPIPPVWALVIGDAIHNLRAALDILACDCLRVQRKSARGISFPFAKDAGGLEDALKGKIRRAGSKVVDEIRQLKPYTGADNSLRDIHDLDIADKHKIVLPTAAAGHLSDPASVTGGFMTGGTLTIIPSQHKDLAGMPLIAQSIQIPNRHHRRAAGWTDQKQEIAGGIKIIFGNSNIQSGQDITSALKLMEKDTCQAVERLSAFFR